MAYKQLTPEQRLIAVSMDLMNHDEFCKFGGLVNIGVNRIVPGMPTAATDGKNKFFGPDFVMALSRKQLRYVMAHECMHVALRHCTEYMGMHKLDPRCFAKAIDYVVNQHVEDMDPQMQFIERPTSPAPLIDPKYVGWSLAQIFRDLRKQQEDEPEDGRGKGKPGGAGDGEPLDEHQMSEPKEGETTEEANEREAAEQQLARDIEDAVRQGQRAYEAKQQLRGTGGGGANIENHMVKRNTNWREPLRRFIQATCQGDENVRWSPLNRVLRACGVNMPSTYSETVGELGIFCDTSGSMHHLYPIVFGEIARLCQHARPAKVRVIWWSDDVEGEQVFEPKDHPNLDRLIKPRGCGGTTVSCVARYVAERKYKFQAGIYLTDGYVESTYDVVKCPTLWGVLDNDTFLPRAGQVIRLHSDAL